MLLYIIIYILYIYLTYYILSYILYLFIYISVYMHILYIVDYPCLVWLTFSFLELQYSMFSRMLSTVVFVSIAALTKVICCNLYTFVKMRRISCTFITVIKIALEAVGCW